MPNSILKQEIEQQPGVIQTLFDQESGNLRQIAGNLSGSFRYIVIAARGTSDNAARYAQYLFGAHNHLPVALATPSLFTLYQQPPRLAGALVIGISQSGHSPDIVAVLAEAKRQGCPTLAIVNNVTSPLAETADYVLPLHAYPEQAIAATKTYTASLGAIALFSCLLEDNPDHIRQLMEMPEKIQQTLDNLGPPLVHVERYRYMEQCTVIGRGYNYATAFEIALKIKELTRTLAEPYSSADFRHGPIAIIHKGFPVILIAPRGAVSENMVELVGDLKHLGSEVLMISNEEQLLRRSQVAFALPPDIPEWLTPLVAVIPGQLFALQLTIEKGMNPDRPEGLTKVTDTM
ncbi:MAG: SIS domain-containing protein [Chloroflexi bacterium]|nr:SIS domain-containing protein [Chloroflexota bacterium]